LAENNRMLGRLLATLAALAVLLSACSSDDDPADQPASPTAAATSIQTPVAATSTATSCPINPAACSLAATIRDALQAGNAQAILNLHNQQSYECPGGQPQGPGGPFPLCQGRPAGERNTGVALARRYSEGFVVAPPEYLRILGQLLQAADPAAADAYGTGALRLYALSCVDPNAPQASCPRFAVIFSGILRPAAIPPLGTTPGREVLVFFANTEGGAPPRIESTWTGIVMANEAPMIFQQGGTLFDLGRIYPYRQP
jgi:hypothetical protein